MSKQDWRAEIDQASYGEKYKIFIDAACSGDVDKLRYCVEEKKLSTSHDESKALKMAAYYGHLEAVKYLHKHGNAWDLSDDHYRPICYAASEGHYEIAEYLVDSTYGQRSCLPPYMVADAAVNGQNKILRMFIEKNVGDFAQNAPWLLRQVAETKHYDTAEILLEAGARSPEALEKAVIHKNLPMLSLLLDYENEDKDDVALKCAQEAGEGEMVRLLHRHKRKGRKLDIMAEMLENRKDVMGMFLETCDMETLRQKRDTDGNSGLLLLAKEGLFFTLCHKNPKAASEMTAEDLLCRNQYFETPMSVLRDRGQLNRLFMQDMWLERRDEIMSFWDRLNDENRKQVDFDAVMMRITRHEMRKDMAKKPIKLKRRTPAQPK